MSNDLRRQRKKNKTRRIGNIPRYCCRVGVEKEYSPEHQVLLKGGKIVREEGRSSVGLIFPPL